MVDFVNVACQQFGIQDASETITSTGDLPSVFAPPHHGPRNVPISTKLQDTGTYSYTHFPIVRTGKYAVYLDTPGVFDGLIYGGANQDTGTGTEIPTSATDFDSCSDFRAGFASSAEIVFNQNDPQPIAIRFKNGSNAGATIKYIVTLMS